MEATRILKALSATPRRACRQGLNRSKIIAVMRKKKEKKVNVPQTEAGSSEAVAPGKAELLSFLKCQRGTGTGKHFWARARACMHEPALLFPPRRRQTACPEQRQQTDRGLRPPKIIVIKN